MLKRFVRMFGGDPNKKEIDRLGEITAEINSLEDSFEKLSADELRIKTSEFRTRLASGETLDDLLPEAFAAVREASKRTLGMRHFDVQMMGGISLHEGKISEMRTGEGKTLVATLPVYLNALTGRGVHLITVNDYLARRDARWKAPIYLALGLSVGVLQMAARTENGKKAFLVDLEKESPHEDQHQLRMVPRREAYAADITYGTNSEFGFDYLRDNMVMRLDESVQRGHYFAVVDEVDNVLIDEARTPLIISGPANDDTEWYTRMALIVRRLRPEDYEISERDRNITLTELGEAHVEELLEMPLRDPDRPEDVTPEQARIMGYLEQALRAQFIFKRNKDYLVQGGKVVIVDEFTGRLMPGRRWSDGLHQSVEAKEGVKVEAENVTYATITLQNYFRMYEKLAGMTGTAVTEAEEFDKIYKLEVLPIPTNLEYQALRSDASLVEVEAKDEQGYRYTYYAQANDSQKQPVFWRRKDYPDVIYLNEEAKFRAIAEEILRYHVQGRPVLVGTTSVELSERVSQRLKAEPLRRLAQVLLIRHAWFEKNDREEDGRQVAELQLLYQPLDSLQASDLRKMATSVDVSMNPEETENLNRLLRILRLEADNKPRLAAALKGGISHEVLNARKHTEESQIIAGAGAFGAVTIATNMAGRGVDIKLGGEMAEEVLAAVNRVLNRAGFEDPYNMQMEQRREALLKLSPENYGIYEGEIRFFLQQLEEMGQVKTLGGLHVIGSERHEARRIDNQLRGRAARQGDPGSSRFYLSLGDDLMRRFGGDQANDLMQRMKVDEALPIELGLVSKLVEQSQTRVEGANFDVRKHLLEYDDVLNMQRSRIYAQRNRIFIKEDLSEDVTEMLRTEVTARVPKSLKDEEGPWALLAWLDQLQPAFSFDGTTVPSYTLQLLVDYVREQMTDSSEQEQKRALLSVAEGALESEKVHLLRAVTTLLEQFEERLDAQLKEREEAIDTFFEGLELSDETDTRTPRELADELSSLAVVPLRLTPEQTRHLREEPLQVKEQVLSQVEQAVSAQGMARLVGAIERRMGESLELSPNQLSGADWDDLAELVYEAVGVMMDRRRERLLGTGSSGQIGKDLEAALAKEKDPLPSSDRQQLRQAVQSSLESIQNEEPQVQTEKVLQNVKSSLARLDGGLSDESKESLLDRIALSLASSATARPDLNAALTALEEEFAAIEESYLESRLVRLLMQMPVGRQTGFDRKTHRRVETRTLLFTYPYFASHLLENEDPEEVAADVLEHLESAQAELRRAWGRAEWKRLAAMRLAEMGDSVQSGFRSSLGDESFALYREQPLETLPVQVRQVVVDEMGRQSLTEIYRQLMLGVITELWVEYLTQMEALRVSVGLEAYGQRDPLVQYKTRASALFQNLLSSMRLGVITRMFTYRPRDLSGLQLVGRKREELEVGQVESTAEAEVSAGDPAPDQPAQAAPQDRAEKARKAEPEGGTKSSRRRRGRR
jgi:preprotein translocase subunit SecA